MTRHEKNRFAAERIIAQISRNLEIASTARIGSLIKTNKASKTEYYSLLRQLRTK